MKIQSIDVSEVINVETESGEYRRFASDDWEKLWGLSWEPFRYCAEIEAEYQRYITTPPSLCKIACDVMNKVFPPGWTTPIWTDTEAPNGVRKLAESEEVFGPGFGSSTKIWLPNTETAKKRAELFEKAFRSQQSCQSRYREIWE